MLTIDTFVSKLKPSFVLVRSSPRTLLPAPSWTNSPETVTSAESPVVNVPAFVTVIVVPMLLPAPFKVSTLPVKANAPVVVTAPPIVVDVVPSDCVNEFASNVEPNTTVSESRIVKLPVPKSTAPVNVTSPNSPASNVTSSSTPPNVPSTTMSSPSPSPV